MSRQYHPVSIFPSPGIPLMVRLKTGEEVKAIRPSYVTSYNSDPDYRDYLDRGKRLVNVIEWSIY